jgi:4-hydroxy-2-oxoheptanedioate aldolase
LESRVLSRAAVSKDAAAFFFEKNKNRGGTMDIKKRDFLLAGAGVVAAGAAAMAQTRRPEPIQVGDRDLVNSHVQPSSVDRNYKPRRVNKAIELWEDGQPIYYGIWGVGPGVDPYSQGVKMARTYLDAINVEMEHGALDFSALREFMRGLVDGGPTPSGHRTPAVFVETCIIGLDEAYMRANSWVLEQLLDCGIHGIHMCHARDTKAVQVATQMACRYPFDRPGIPKLPMRGLRGSAAGYAAQCWGVELYQYNHLADLWPLNPKGELIFGVKIEDTFADEQAESTIALPGISMAEWGPGDHSYWLDGLSIMEDGKILGDITTLASRPEMVKVGENVRQLCKKHNVRFLHISPSNDPANPFFVNKQIDEGVMVFESNDEPSAITGREHSKRKMPV